MTEHRDPETLSPALRAVLGLKSLMGGLCRSALPEVLRNAHIAPPTGHVWNPSVLRAAEHTLHTLGFLDTAHSPVPGLEGEAVNALEIPHALAVLISILLEREASAHKVDPVRLRLRLAVFANDVKGFFSAKSRLMNLSDPYGPEPRPLKDQFLDPMPSGWLHSRAPELVIELFAEHACCWSRGRQAAILPDEIVLIQKIGPVYTDRLADHADAATVLVLAGADDVVKRMAPGLGDLPALGVAAFCEGDFSLARRLFVEARKALRTAADKRTLQLTGVPGLTFALCLLLERDATLRDELEKLLTAMKKQNDTSRAICAVQALLHMERGEMEEATFILDHSYISGTSLFDEAIFLTAVACVKPKNAARFRVEGKELFEKAHSMPVVAQLFWLALKALGHEPLPAFDTVRVPDIPGLLGGLAVWERRLESLAHLLRGEKTQPATQRLAWMLNPAVSNLVPMVQAPKGSGWTAGRAVALKRLHEAGPEQDWLTAQDRKVIATIEWKPNWSGGLHGEFNMPRTLLELVGHPLLFHHVSRAPLTLEREDAVLEVRETADGCELRLTLPPGGPLLTPRHKDPKCAEWVVHHVPPGLQNALPVLLDQPLRVPRPGLAKVMDFISLAAPHIPLRTNLTTSTTEGCPRPVVRLAPQGNGIRADFLVRPLPVPEGPVFTTGKGSAEPMCRVEGRLLAASRDFAEERKALRLLLAACPSLAVDFGNENDPDPSNPDQELPANCVLETLSEALQALLELGEAAETLPEFARPVMEWPQGERFRVLAQAKPEQLQLRTRKAGDWFRLEGSLTLDALSEQRVLDMAELLTRLEQSSGLFVPLGDGQFLSLTRQLRRRLDRLRRLSEQDRDGSRRIHPLAASAVDDILAETLGGELADGAEAGLVGLGGIVETDAAWKARVALLRSAPTVSEPPSTLRADLRDYQLEGYQWLSRLCALGAGACLADDMGLGKTVQTLALLLEQAPHGPSLVVAPMSVCHNWEQEATRFAPTLRVHRLGQTADKPERTDKANKTDRAEQILALGAGDVLVTSYNLLQLEQMALATHFWRVIVFDEAQALKNPATKRAKAARALRTGFRLALTGTPIENRLEDLWSLFHILNPGLLGSLPSFRKRFSAAGVTDGAVSEEGRNPARQALKTLIRPFILRRTKAGVLSELPPRIEQVLDVELPPEERAIYEALRRKALKEIEAMNRPGGQERQEASGQRRLAILAELTRLRRATCHPALLDPQTHLPGAKLEAFLELARELRAGRHKVLVFSQFVGHLNLVRTALEKAGAKPGNATARHESLLWTPPESWSSEHDASLKDAVYQYLDGSTPERERQRAVAAFQQGEGDLFLISLKAGGQGLNLTAADFVIHLDPWWNPAVEDQASDRAHRIGQTRPVTIYRLVTRNTVEEKILTLHHAKRALAADFLTGADAPLSESELLALFNA